MIKINYPNFSFKIKGEQINAAIFDEIRKQWVKLLPEEWVRQNFIQFLLQEMHYPASLIAVEKEIKLGSLSKRCDLIVYNNQAPWMLIECKAPKINISEETLLQALRYHQSVPVPFICLTNGTQVYLFEKQNQQFTEINEFPKWGNNS